MKEKVKLHYRFKGLKLNQKTKIAADCKQQVVADPESIWI